MCVHNFIDTLKKYKSNSFITKMRTLKMCLFKHSIAVLNLVYFDSVLRLTS